MKYSFKTVINSIKYFLFSLFDNEVDNILTWFVQNARKKKEKYKNIRPSLHYDEACIQCNKQLCVKVNIYHLTYGFLPFF